VRQRARRGFFARGLPPLSVPNGRAFAASGANFRSKSRLESTWAVLTSHPRGPVVDNRSGANSATAFTVVAARLQLSRRGAVTIGSVNGRSLKRGSRCWRTTRTEPESSLAALLCAPERAGWTTWCCPAYLPAFLCHTTVCLGTSHFLTDAQASVYRENLIRTTHAYQYKGNGLTSRSIKTASCEGSRNAGRRVVQYTRHGPVIHY